MTEVEINVKLFKKFNCIKCGTPIKINKTKKVYYPGDPGFKKECGNIHSSMVSYKKYTYIRYNYKCPNCSKETAYLQQVAYSKIQKKLNKKILTEEDLRNN